MNPEVFDRISLFSGLDGEARMSLARLLNRQTFDANETLFWVGDPGDRFYIVESGRLSISCPDQSGQEIVLAILGPGDFFGEISLLDGEPRSATARALVPTMALSLNRPDFIRFISEHPSAAIAVLEVLARRQRKTVDQLRGIRPLNEVMQERLSTWQRIATGIANLAGSQTFLLIHVVLASSWLMINVMMGPHGPDPFPFAFLCFWASLESIFLSLFILGSQKLQGQKDRVRSELEYQIALKVQAEIMQLQTKVAHLPQMVADQLATHALATQRSLGNTAAGCDWQPLPVGSSADLVGPAVPAAGRCT